MDIYKNSFFCVVVFLIALTSIFSYMRFFVNHDYLVSYEGECNHLIYSCFKGCDDEECNEPYNYSIMQKHAVDLYTQCGDSPVGCDVANRCLPNGDRACSVTYCDEKVDGEVCDTVTTVNGVNDEA